jgi:GNAT superfamily N-acetyltransferase
MNRSTIINTISNDILGKLYSSLLIKPTNSRSFDSHITTTGNNPDILVSFKYRIVTESPNGYLNLKINNPKPKVFKNFIRFYDLRINESLRGQGIFTDILGRIEKYCDRTKTTIIVSEFANQKLAYYLGTKRGYNLHINKNTKTNLNLMRKFLNNTKNLSLFERIQRKGIPGEKAEYAIRFPKPVANYPPLPLFIKT